jgi:Co/Zn/Cd efflux system component
MLADSQAMVIDAVTYLFNLIAERLKVRPFTKQELLWTPQARAYFAEKRRLYLELFPPLVSVTCLVAITILTLREAIGTLREPKDEADDVSVKIMLLFSAGNLLLDMVNVTCFARAQSAFGLDMVRQENATIFHSFRDHSSNNNETTGLINSNSHTHSACGSCNALPIASYGSQAMLSQEIESRTDMPLVNLNMCSAWTVSVDLSQYIVLCNVYLVFSRRPHY